MMKMKIMKKQIHCPCLQLVDVAAVVVAVVVVAVVVSAHQSLLPTQPSPSPSPYAAY